MLVVIDIPSNKIYQAYLWAAEPPDTAHISLWPSSSSPGQSILYAMSSDKLLRFLPGITPPAITALISSHKSAWSSKSLNFFKNKYTYLLLFRLCQLILFLTRNFSLKELTNHNQLQKHNLKIIKIYKPVSQAASNLNFLSYSDSILSVGGSNGLLKQSSFPLSLISCFISFIRVASVQTASDLTFKMILYIHVVMK